MARDPLSAAPTAGFPAGNRLSGNGADPSATCVCANGKPVTA